MKVVATVLYQDTMLPNAEGNYPLHDLVMRMVEDDINGMTWRLRKAVDKSPCKGISQLIRTARRTNRIAGSGRLYALVDLDQVHRDLGLPKASTEDDLVNAMRVGSDAPEKLFPLFLRPNLEGLLKGFSTV